MRRSFWLILLVAAALRLGCAFFSIGFDHANENYRTLEPIAALNGYSTVLPFEWHRQMLSWLPVHAQRDVLVVAQKAGIETPLAQATLLRVLYALLSLLPILVTYRLLQKSFPRGALFGAALVAFWPEFIFRSVRLIDYALEAPLYALAILGFLRAESSASRRAVGFFALSGLALGVLFFVRFQSGLFLIALLAGLLVSHCRSWAKALALVVGYGVTVFALAFLENRLTSQGFLSPFIHYIQYNWAEGGATRDFGADPWHRYLSELAKFYSFGLFFAALGLLVSAAFTRTIDRVAALFFGIPLLAYTLIPHKEARFVYGFAWLLVPLALSALAEWSRSDQESRFGRKGLKRAFLILLTVLFLASLVHQGHRVNRRLEAGRDETRDFVAIGEALRQRDLPSQAIWIDAASHAVPCGFYLRSHAPIYFSQGGNPSPIPEPRPGDLLIVPTAFVQPPVFFLGKKWCLSKKT